MTRLLLPVYSTRYRGSIWQPNRCVNTCETPAFLSPYLFLSCPVLPLKAVALNCGAQEQSAAAFYLPLTKVARALDLIQRGKKASVVWQRYFFDWWAHQQRQRASEDGALGLACRRHPSRDEEGTKIWSNGRPDIHSYERFFSSSCRGRLVVYLKPAVTRFIVFCGYGVDFSDGLM